MSRRVRLIGLWMAAAGLIGIWISVVLQDLLAMVLIGLVSVTGVVKICTAGRGDAAGNLPASDSSDAYLKAWRAILRQRWLLSIVVTIAAVAAMGQIVTHALGFTTGFFPPHKGIVQTNESVDLRSLLDRLQSQFLRAVNDSCSQFFPRIGLPEDPVLRWSRHCWCCFVFHGLAVGYEFSKAIRYSSAARFMGALIIPIALVAVLTVISVLCSSRLVSIVIFAAMPWLIEILCYAVIVPVVIGGMAGSLGMLARSEPVTRETFFADAVKSYPSVAALYFLAVVLISDRWAYFYLQDVLLPIVPIMCTIHRRMSSSGSCCSWFLCLYHFRSPWVTWACVRAFEKE